MSATAPTTLPSSLHPLLTRGTSATDPTLPSLRPTKPFDASLRPTIDALALPASLRGVLHLLNDDLDAAHRIVQDDEGVPSSDLIHSILHRREADYWNSKWWLDQFRHPFLARLYDEEEYGEVRRRAKRFVDEVEALLGGRGGKGKGGATTACGATKKMDELKRFQWREIKGLADYVFQECGVQIESPQTGPAA